MNKHLTSTIIPANLHYNEPNEDIPSLIDGTLQVVNQNTTWNGGLIGINSFGVGGSNDHAIFKSNGRERSTVFLMRTVQKHPSLYMEIMDSV